MNNVRIKVVRVRKVMPKKNVGSYEGWKLQMADQVRQAASAGYKIVFVDELTFTNRTMKSMEYSGKYNNIQID